MDVLVFSRRNSFSSSTELSPDLFFSSCVPVSCLEISLSGVFKKKELINVLQPYRLSGRLHVQQYMLDDLHIVNDLNLLCGT